MRSVDVHQHLWPEAVLRVLERRGVPPKATWRRDRWHVELPAEPGFDVHPKRPRSGRAGARVARRPRARRALAARRPGRASRARRAGGRRRLAGGRPRPAARAGLVGRDAQLPARGRRGRAGARGDRRGRGGPVPARRPGCAAPSATLAAVADAGAPVLIHPGPATGGHATDPAWWSPATDYVAQQHAAWHTFRAVVRPALPTLRVIFAALAGLAPLQAERTATKGGPGAEPALADQLSFYDTSSYGPRATRAMATAVGIGQLVHGTDFPVDDPADDPVRGRLRRGLRQARQDQRHRPRARLRVGAVGAGGLGVSDLRATLESWAAREDLAPLATHRPGRAHPRAAPPRRRRRDLPDRAGCPATTRASTTTTTAPRRSPSSRARSRRSGSRSPATVERTVGPGEIVTIAREAIHRVRHSGTRPATTLHAYSPPLQRVGTYEVAGDGALLRHPRPAETRLEAAA